MLAGVSYLLRVVLPDLPGSLGALATALGAAGADILSLDVVERAAGRAVDDILVETSAAGLPDGLLSAAEGVPGVVVESLRPYNGSRDMRGDLEYADALAARPDLAWATLASAGPGVFHAGWAMVCEAASGDASSRLRILAASPASPVTTELRLPWLPLAAATALAADAAWVPLTWVRLATALAAAPVGSPHRAVLVGRPGGPGFRGGEVARLGHLASLAAAVSRAAGRSDGAREFGAGHLPTSSLGTGEPAG